MAEVIRERIVERPSSHVVHDNGTGRSDNGIGFLMGIVLLVVVLYLLFMYGLPMIRSAAAPTQVQIPDKVDVNVNTPAQ